MEEAAGVYLALGGGWRSAAAKRVTERRTAAALSRRGCGGWATPAPAHRKSKEEMAALLVRLAG